MARTPSTMLALGTPAPAFRLLNPATNKQVALEDFHGSKGLLVIFLCNHCPFVKHLAAKLAETTSDYLARGLAVVGINSNDVANFPDDSPEQMVIEARVQNYRFPYLFDETQEVARAYQAACTPDFFLFDANMELVYRGQFDSSRPGNAVSVTGDDLSAAVNNLLSGRLPDPNQTPSLGCNIKWK